MKARRTIDGAQWAGERHLEALHQFPTPVTEHLSFQREIPSFNLEVVYESGKEKNPGFPSPWDNYH